MAVADFLKQLATQSLLPLNLRQSWPDGMFGKLIVFCYQYAACLGSPEGQYALGLSYLWGWAVPRDALTGNQWLARAGAQGHSEAAFTLAEHYHFREAVARRRLRRSPETWCLMRVLFGDRHQEYEGVERDYKSAAFWYRVAADKGDARAALRLGRLLETGKGGLCRDLAEALTLYARAAAAGNKTAEIRMARLAPLQGGPFPASGSS